MEDIKKALDDVLEDHREEGESINDDLNQEDKDPKDRAIDNEIAEDHREEGESLEDLKAIILSQAKEIERLTRERDEAHNVFMNEGREYEEDEERSYKSMIKNIK